MMQKCPFKFFTLTDVSISRVKMILYFFMIRKVGLLEGRSLFTNAMAGGSSRRGITKHNPESDLMIVVATIALRGEH